MPQLRSLPLKENGPEGSSLKEVIKLLSCVLQFRLNPTDQSRKARTLEGGEQLPQQRNEVPIGINDLGISERDPERPYRYHAGSR